MCMKHLTKVSVLLVFHSEPNENWKISHSCCRFIHLLTLTCFYNRLYLYVKIWFTNAIVLKIEETNPNLKCMVLLLHEYCPPYNNYTFKYFLLFRHVRSSSYDLPVGFRATEKKRKARNLRNSVAGSWGTGPVAWGRRHLDPPPCRPARCRRAAGSLCPTWGFFWGCWRPSPPTVLPCWAGSRRRRSTCRLWSRPETRKAWWRPRGSRNLQTINSKIHRRVLLAAVALCYRLGEKKELEKRKELNNNLHSTATKMSLVFLQSCSSLTLVHGLSSRPGKQAGESVCSEEDLHLVGLL